MTTNSAGLARLIQWNQEDRSGFLEYEGMRLLLHAHDFVRLKRQIRVGDDIRFTVGVDTDGKACAKNARHAEKGLKLVNLLLLTALLVVPVRAIEQLGQSHDLRLLLGGAAVVGLLTFLVYWEDKRRMRAAGWRVPANTMHVMELIGGWPAAYLAQRLLGHQRGRFSYQLTFWLIVALYQFVALDYLRGWPLCKAAQQGYERVVHRR